MGIPIAWSLHMEHFGSLGEAVQDGMGDGVVMKDLVPFSEEPIGGDNG